TSTSKGISQGKIRGADGPVSGELNGDSEVGKNGLNGLVPLGIQQHNPGNLRHWSGVPTVNGFASFESDASGIAAMKKQLELYFGRGLNTLDSIIGTYAPSSENDTGAYISDVSGKTGFKHDQPLNPDSATLKSLM